MSLFLDTETVVPVEIEGTTFNIKSLTARERLRVGRYGIEISDLVSGFPDDEDGGVTISAATVLEVQEKQYEILAIGLADQDADKIAPRVWSQLCTEIMNRNSLREDDSEN